MVYGMNMGTGGIPQKREFQIWEIIPTVCITPSKKAKTTTNDAWTLYI